MYCSTCGAFVPAGRVACDTCGARVVSVREPVVRVAVPLGIPEEAQLRGLAVCPRCGYRGDGVGYFTRGRHLAGLVAAAMVTSWGMGVGALVYYLLRREHRICPRCGEGWGPRSEHALVRVGQPTAPVTAAGAVGPAPLPDSPFRMLSFLLFVLAAVLAIGAIAGGNPASLGLAALSAGGGLLVHRAADSDREKRRAALISSLQLPVLKLASERGGRLTVTQVATHLGWTLPRAEKVLESLEDGYRVSSEVTDEGLIVYEFRELLADPSRPRLPAEEG